MVKEINSSEFEKKVLGNNKLVIVDFFATWCMPCKMLTPIMEEVSNNNSQVDIFKINIDKCVELTEKYDIEVVPTIVFFKNGKVSRVETGTRTENEINEIIKELINND